MAKKDERFIKTYGSDKFFQISEIWVDKETGVNYFFHSNSVGSGLTVLVDREGKPVITTVFPDDE
ncbi:DUF6440 family protein [Allocoprobacillus halotolerans]|uniref:DUF6440 family protein n=1 Tax=Allocoprobacillus halotolerans TaxID=2944914 RepID=A0ABY5I2G2_9FIRM|nr:DUF6440 family protein [Allocoprobacillus halotolerans]UTY38913.1 DUF6440 family protein [Allocoprobacillus halotolerans]